MRTADFLDITQSFFHALGYAYSQHTANKSADAVVADLANQYMHLSPFITEVARQWYLKKDNVLEIPDTLLKESKEELYKLWQQYHDLHKRGLPIAMHKLLPKESNGKQELDTSDGKQELNGTKETVVHPEQEKFKKDFNNLTEDQKTLFAHYWSLYKLLATFGVSIQELLNHQRSYSIDQDGNLFLNNKHIDELNGLNDIKPDTGQELTALQVLYLDDNQISDINPSAFQRFSALEYLNLDKNKIGKIKSGAFQGLTSLLKLNLSGNKISVINPGVFQGLTALQELILDDNKITETDIEKYRTEWGLTSAVKVGA